MVHMDDDDWAESTEGDLDYDLTEEAGYAGWDAPQREGLSLAMRAGLLLMLLVLAGGAALVVVR